MLGTDFPENILPDDDGVGFLEAVTPILSAPDVTFGNLEGVLHGRRRAGQAVQEPEDLLPVPHAHALRRLPAARGLRRA